MIIFLFPQFFSIMKLIYETIKELWKNDGKNKKTKDPSPTGNTISHLFGEEPSADATIRSHVPAQTPSAPTVESPGNPINGRLPPFGAEPKNRLKQPRLQGVLRMLQWPFFAGQLNILFIFWMYLIYLVPSDVRTGTQYF